MVVMSLLVFKETHAPTILKRRAKHFRRTTGNPRYYTEVERLDLGRSMSWIIRNSLTRPIRMLMFHPIVQVQALMSGFSYGILYLVLSTFSDLWINEYHESISISGLHYIVLCLGEVVGSVIGGPLIDYVFRRLKKRADGVATPEFRVPIMLPAFILGPLGLFMYGWAADKHVQWIVVDIGVAIMAFGMQIGGMALQAYVIDSYPDHTSSASAATQFLRSLAAFGFPLFAPKMYQVLGYGWGNSTLAFTGLSIGIPAPLLIWVYGSKLRAKAQASH